MGLPAQRAVRLRGGLFHAHLRLPARLLRGDAKGGGRMKRAMLVHAVLVLASFAAIYPVLWVVGLALDPAQGAAQARGLWPLPAHFSARSFGELLEGGLFLRQLGNSLLVSALTTI